MSVTRERLEEIRNALRRGERPTVDGRRVEWAWKGENLVVFADDRKPIGVRA